MHQFSAEPIDLGQWLSPAHLLKNVWRGVLGLPRVLTRHALLPALVGASIALILYGLLPYFGVKQFVQLLSFKKLLLLCVLMAGGVGYWIFLDFIKKHADWLLYIAFVGLPLLIYVTNVGLSNGINLYKNGWLIVGICIPALYMGWPYLATIWKRLPIYKFFVLYLLIAGYFYVFNHHQVFDGRFTDGSQPRGFHLFFTSIYHFLTITIAGCAVAMEKKPRSVFNAFNTIVLWLTLVYSVVCLVTYPFHIFTEFLEEVHRTRFLFLFTNEYSFYMQFVVTYLLGIYFYQLERAKPDQEVEGNETETTLSENKAEGASGVTSRLTWQVLYPVTIVLGTLAMMTSFTKTSIGVLVLVIAVILLCNAGRVLKNKAVMLGLAVLPFVMAIGLMVFQVATDTNLMAGIEARMNNTASMSWRERVWDYLLEDMPPVTWLTGHGFTAASERMKIYEVYVESEDATSNGMQVIAVHNSYLEQLYDMGVGGIVILLALIGYMLRIVNRLIPKKQADPHYPPRLRTLDATLLGMILTYLILCFVNNTFSMIEQPFWIMATMLWLAHESITRELTPQMDTQGDTEPDKPSKRDTSQEEMQITPAKKRKTIRSKKASRPTSEKMRAKMMDEMIRARRNLATIDSETLRGQSRGPHHVG
ncbi:MAG: O-antigen ligase family protein [Vampirovibrionales bacterium]|nr:O-antigen ligase family protein [Vampirovibrionales bacterium]